MNTAEKYNDLNQVIECPICMDIIEGTNNKVTTECGHVFHCSCLMHNSACNGFGCPYCRTIMATAPDDSDSDSDDSEFSISSTFFEDDILTSFRMFHQQLNGEEVEEEEEEEDGEEEEGDEEDEEGDEDDEEDNVLFPSPEYISQKLLERGVTYEDLVKKILFCEHRRYENFERISDEIYGKFRAIMSQYRPEQVAVSEQVAVPEQVAVTK